jgi:hypothetical protein
LIVACQTRLSVPIPASFWSARDKGKSPLVDTFPPAHAPDCLSFNVSDFQPVGFFHSAPLYMNSIIQISGQEISDCSSPTHPVHLTDFLSSWSPSHGPISSSPSPKPFQIRGPFEPIYLPLDPNRFTPILGLPPHTTFPHFTPLGPVYHPDSQSSTSPPSPKPFQIHSLHLCRSSIRPSLTTESLTSLQFATPKGEVSDSDSPIATPITPMLPSLMFPQGLSTKPVTSPTYPPHDRECSHCHCN